MTNEQIYLAALQQLQQALNNFQWNNQVVDGMYAGSVRDAALSTIATAIAAATPDDGAAKK